MDKFHTKCFQAIWEFKGDIGLAEKTRKCFVSAWDVGNEVWIVE